MNIYSHIKNKRFRVAKKTVYIDNSVYNTCTLLYIGIHVQGYKVSSKQGTKIISIYRPTKSDLNDLHYSTRTIYDIVVERFAKYRLNDLRFINHDLTKNICKV